MLLRNREVRRTVGVSAVVAGAGALCAWRLAGAPAAACVVVTALALLAVWLAATRERYRALARMASQVDDILHGGPRRELRAHARGRARDPGLRARQDEESRLTLANEELAHEKNALADALADISHQLKTPLTSLALMTSLVRRELVAEGAHEAGVKRLHTMERLEDRVEWLVSSLLKLARIDAGVVRFTRGRVDGAELVARAADPLAVAFDLADVRLTADVAPGAGFTGDLAWTAEALENVLKNCLEHTPAGGEVRVSCAEDALAFRLCVEDTGPGIAAEDLPHVFERFYRGGERGGRAGSEVDPTGVGIGLALARSLVTAQGGSIRAGNAPGGGGALRPRLLQGHGVGAAGPSRPS